MPYFIERLQEVCIRTLMKTYGRSRKVLFGGHLKNDLSVEYLQESIAKKRLRVSYIFLYIAILTKEDLQYLSCHRTSSDDFLPIVDSDY